MYDVLIIGGGVTGSAIARELSRYDLKTALFEKGEDVCSGTSKANSGIAHAGFDAAPGSWKAKMNIRGSRLCAGRGAFPLPPRLGAEKGVCLLPPAGQFCPAHLWEMCIRDRLCSMGEVLLFLPYFVSLSVPHYRPNCKVKCAKFVRLVF